MDFFHGTDQTAANAMALPPPPKVISVGLGGGELGQGFYVGDNMTLSIAWAKGRYTSPSVLKLTGNDAQYATLSFKQMQRRAIFQIWRQMKKMGTLRTHQFSFDVIFGPLATNPYAAQYKFESAAAENFLNHHCTITKVL